MSDDKNTNMPWWRAVANGATSLANHVQQQVHRATPATSRSEASAAPRMHETGRFSPDELEKLEEQAQLLLMEAVHTCNEAAQHLAGPPEETVAAAESVRYLVRLLLQILTFGVKEDWVHVFASGLTARDAALASKRAMQHSQPSALAMLLALEHGWRQHCGVPVKASPIVAIKPSASHDALTLAVLHASYNEARLGMLFGALHGVRGGLLTDWTYTWSALRQQEATELTDALMALDAIDRAGCLLPVTSPLVAAHQQSKPEWQGRLQDGVARAGSILGTTWQRAISRTQQAAAQTAANNDNGEHSMPEADAPATSIATDRTETATAATTADASACAQQHQNVSRLSQSADLRSVSLDLARRSTPREVSRGGSELVEIVHSGGLDATPHATTPSRACWSDTGESFLAQARAAGELARGTDTAASVAEPPFACDATQPGSTSSDNGRADGAAASTSSPYRTKHASWSFHSELRSAEGDVGIATVSKDSLPAPNSNPALANDTAHAARRITAAAFARVLEREAAPGDGVAVTGSAANQDIMQRRQSPASPSHDRPLEQAPVSDREAVAASEADSDVATTREGHDEVSGSRTDIANHVVDTAGATELEAFCDDLGAAVAALDGALAAPGSAAAASSARDVPIEDDPLAVPDGRAVIELHAAAAVHSDQAAAAEVSTGHVSIAASENIARDHTAEAGSSPPTASVGQQADQDQVAPQQPAAERDAAVAGLSHAEPPAPADIGGALHDAQGAGAGAEHGREVSGTLQQDARDFDPLAGEASGRVSIHVRDAYVVSDSSGGHATYDVAVAIGSRTAHVSRRFSSFLKLRQQLLTAAKSAGGVLPDSWNELTKASFVFGRARNTPEILAARCSLLEHCLADLLEQAPHLLVHESTLTFLGLTVSAFPADFQARVQSARAAAGLGHGHNPQHDQVEQEAQEVFSSCHSATGSSMKITSALPWTLKETEAELWQLQQGVCRGCKSALPPLPDAAAQSSFWSRLTTRQPEGPRRCYLDGWLYCHDCHSGHKATIPAQVLTAWDFKHYPVSDNAADFLRTTRTAPMLRVEPTSSLFAYVPLLNEVTATRRRIHQLLELCSQRDVARASAGLMDLMKRARGREYLLNSIDMFTLADLEDMGRGGAFAALPEVLNQLCADAEALASQCLLSKDAAS